MLDILCEDGPVIAVNKPPGVISQGAPIGTPSLVSMVKDYLKEKYNKPGDVYLGVPHRIDRPVSGVVVFSRNSKCAARLAEQFAKREVRKTYVAVLESPPPEDAGTLRDWLYRIPNEPKVIVCSPDRVDAKEAVLHYKVLKRVRGRALVEIDLGTGRMHQIRIQFGSRGWPIVGMTSTERRSHSRDTAWGRITDRPARRPADDPAPNPVRATADPGPGAEVVERVRIWQGGTVFGSDRPQNSRSRPVGRAHWPVRYHALEIFL